MFMAILLIVFGVVSFVYGLLSVLGCTKNDLSKDSELDKNLYSKETRYFISRYVGGLKFIIAGLGAILLGLAIYFGQ